MKKVMTLAFCLITSVVMSQSVMPEYISGKIISEIGAVIEDKRIEEGKQLTFATPPGYTNLDLIVAKVNQVIDANPNTRIILPWERTENKFYACIVGVGDETLYIRYTPDLNQLLTIYTIKEKTHED